MWYFVGVLIALMLIGVTALILYFKKQFNYWSSRNVPSLEPSIPMGNLGGVGTKLHFAELTSKVYEQFKRGHQFAGFYYMNLPSVITIDLDLVKNILVKDFSSFHQRGIYYNEKADPLSGHLFNLDGQKWREFRTKLSPTFTSGKMKMMFPTILKSTADLRAKLTQLAENKIVCDTNDICARFTADVIGSCAFGFECSCLTTENAEFMKESTRILDYSSPMRKFLLFFQNSFPKIAKLINMRVFDKQSERFFRSIMNDTISHRDKSQVERNDFMQLLLHIHRSGVVKASSSDEKDVDVGKMSFDEMLAQAFVFFVAGFETTSTSMTFALYELAYNQDIQNAARSEAKQIYEKYGNKFTYEGVLEMNYIGQVIDGIFIQTFCKKMVF